MDWKRILLWSMLIFAVVNVVAFSFGLTMAWWHIYGETIEEAAANSRLVWLSAVELAAIFCYWRFARGATTMRLWQVLAVLVLFELIDIGVSAVFALSTSGTLATHSYLPSQYSLGRQFLAAAIGFVAANLSSSNSFKPSSGVGSRIH